MRLAESARAETMRQKRRSSASSLRVSHSQITSTRQPIERSDSATRRSRSMLDENLLCQNVGRVAGVVANRQPAWRCQKQPCTNTKVFRAGKTMSGRPGSLRSCTRNRRPAACMYRLTACSGRVSRGPIPAIIRDRVVVSTTSTTHQLLPRGAALLATALCLNAGPAW